MANEPNYEKLVASIRKNLGNTQSQVETKLPATDEVSKILSSNAKANIVSSEIDGRDVVYSGFVNFQVVYVTNEGTIESADYSAEFREKFNANMELNGTPVVSVSVVDVNAVINGEIKATATIEVKVDIIQTSSHNVLTAVNGDTYYTKKQQFDYSTFEGSVTNKFEVVNDVEIKDSILKVLTVCPTAYIEKVTPYERYVTVAGGVYLDVCYLSDNNIIRTYLCKFEFSEDVAGDMIDSDSLVQSMLQISFNDVKVTSNIDTDNAIVNVSIPLIYTGQIYKNNTAQIVSDVYSTKYFSSVSVESISSIKGFESFAFDEKLNGSKTIGDNDPFIDEVLGVCASSVVVANSMVNDKFLTVEGVATASVLYLNKELSETYSVEIEMPFSASSAVNLPDGTEVLAMVDLTDLNARARRGKEIEVVANLEVFVDTYTVDTDVVITNITEEDEIPEEECAMSFYITKDGDTLWEIAKELRVSIDTLVSQNPTLSEESQAGTRVVVYRQRQVEF